MRTRFVYFLVALAVIIGVGVAMFQGVGPLPDPEGCSAEVGNVQVDLSTEQAENATLISAIGVRRGLPARAVSIALATAYQESKLRNLTHGDRDSLGLFQQRPSMGWGTAEEVRDPYHATNKFYDVLVKIDGYEKMPITEAAQRVQRSAFPDAYADHEEDGRALASALTGYSAGGRFSCVVHDFSTHGTADEVTRSLNRAFGDTDPTRTGTHEDLQVALTGSRADRRTGWSIAQFLVAHAIELKVTAVSFDGKTWRSGKRSESGWTDADSRHSRVDISLG